MARGVEVSEQGNAKYLSFSKGNFALRVTEQTTGAVARKLAKGPNEGTLIYELLFEKLEGQIVDISQKVDGMYGPELKIKIDCSYEEVEEVYILSLNFTDIVATNLMNQLIGFDMSKDVILRGYRIKREDDATKFNNLLIAYPADFTGAKPTKLPRKFDRDSTEVPAPNEVLIQGKKVNDYFNVAEFFYTHLVAGVSGVKAPAVAVAPANENDDLPF